MTVYGTARPTFEEWQCVDADLSAALEDHAQGVIGREEMFRVCAEYVATDVARNGHHAVRTALPSRYAREMRETFMQADRDKARREELYASGKRAVYKGQCDSVIVAPDHTGEDNYHLCGGKRDHQGAHGSGSGYAWDREGVVQISPYAEEGGA